MALSTMAGLIGLALFALGVLAWWAVCREAKEPIRTFNLTPGYDILLDVYVGDVHKVWRLTKREDQVLPTEADVDALIIMEGQNYKILGFQNGHLRLAKC